MDRTNDKPKLRHHLNRQIVFACLIFTLALCLAMGAASYFTLRNALMQRYETELSDVLNITMAQIDVDDLQRCMETKTESDQFKELMSYMDSVRQSSSLAYLAIVQPVKTDDVYDVLAVLSGLLPEERAGTSMREDMVIPQLGDSTAAAYDPAFMAAIYDDMLNRHDIKFSTSSTAYGQTFDAATSIRNAQGEGVALLTAGMASDSINATMMNNLAMIVGFGLLLSGVFLLFMSVWFRRRVIKPINRIEQSADEFAQKSKTQSNAQALVLDLSDIRTGNELESLAGSLEAMSRDMREYVDDLISSTMKIEGMEREIARVNEIAMKDGLTGVRNKASFNAECARLEREVAEGAADFAFLMMDLNNLKHINDTYGHDKGDRYITTACDALCETFAHSPVFRVGGDEFVALLEGNDLAARDELIGRFRDLMSSSKDQEPWQRISAAVGVAVYDRAQDDSVDAVLARADRAMYADKATTR